MERRNTIILLAGGGLIIIGAVFLRLNLVKPVTVKNFAQCTAAGYPVTGTSPVVCTAPDGQIFTDVDSLLPENRPIRITSPQAGARVSSPLTVKGEARGSWFNEATFPVTLMDSGQHILVSAPAKAEGDWMTDDFVPFSAVLTFKTPATASGILILMKDNPSGLRENAADIRIPVSFSK